MALLSLLEVLAFTVSLLREGRTFPGITAWAAVSKVVALLPHRDLNTQLRRLILIGPISSPLCLCLYDHLWFLSFAQFCFLKKDSQ